MTRNEFLEDVTDFGELMDFCRDMNLDTCDDIIDGEYVSESIEEDLSSLIGVGSWRDIRDCLNVIEDGYAYYRRDGDLDYVPMDESDFSEYMNTVLEYMDDNGLWDEEDDEDAAEPSPAPEIPDTEDDRLIVDDTFTVSDVIHMCGATLLTLEEASARRR